MRRINAVFQQSNIFAKEAYLESKKSIQSKLTTLANIDHTYKDYFIQTGNFLLMMMVHDDQLHDNAYFEQSFETLKEENHKLYEDVLHEGYMTSYVNPTYACSVYGKKMGQFLSAIAYDFRTYVGMVYESRYADMNQMNRLFLLLYQCMIEGDQLEVEPLISAVKSHRLNHLETLVEHQWIRNLLPRFDVYSHIVKCYDLSDLRYLFRYGMYIGSNEVLQAEHILSLSEEKQQRIADTYTEAYIRGFQRNNVSLEHKESVLVTYHLGFEAIMKKAFDNFGKIGLKPFAFYHLRGRQRPRLYNTKPNKQMEYDHRYSDAFFLDEAYINTYMTNFKKVLKKYEREAYVYSGLALFEVFGEEAFEPINHEANMAYDSETTALDAKLKREIAMEHSKYIPGDAYSFTINDYPLPSIGANYKEIFDATIEVNTLDASIYERIHGAMIDALDQCDHVVVKGRDGNETDISVRLYPLTNRDEQTIFCNCTADVNVPVGEIYTSPVLKGTKGLLHVKEVYLTGLLYKDLKIWFEDGMITEYSCSNFDSESENKKFVHETLLHPHHTLPLGEFAIGTNTVAYMMAKEFDIQDKLPILIGEKTGPHFAIGDTCFVWGEDTPVYNSNGKEVVARENEKTCQRISNVEDAYTYKHTDITIAYNELDTIIGYNSEGEAYKLIERGRFVLPGTELLNQPFDEE